jgi:serine protease AprX
MPFSRTARFLIAPFLACMLLAPTLATSVAAAGTPPPTQITLDPTLKISPFLQYGMQADPTATVRVIVQKTSASASALLIALKVPGVLVTEEFKVIPAFVAIAPISAIAALARDTNVRYLSPDGSVQVLPGLQLPTLGGILAGVKKPKTVKASKSDIDTSNLLTTYPFDTGATGAWSSADGSVETGSKVTVALIDSGVDATHADVSGQITSVNVNSNTLSTGDGYGHGTHVAGIIMGHNPTGQYTGIAPDANLVSIKIADDTGLALESDLLRGLDWLDTNQSKLKIRAVNLSVSTSLPESYATSPIDAAVERLWHDGVTVVAAAGNLGPDQDAVWYAPGNDPYVITVGCLDENATTSPADDSLCPISSRGVTEDGFTKPDMVAPGRKIVSALATAPNGNSVVLAGEFPDRITADGQHIRLSGTSMAAPMVTGAIALLLQRHSNLTPGQIKQILVQSTRTYPGQPDAAGTLNITAALLLSDHPPVVSQPPILPASGVAAPAGADTVLWDGARWGSAFWDGARWGSTYLDGARWGSSEWDGARWGSAYWDGARWGSTYWDGARWGNASWDGARWGVDGAYD